MMKDDYHFNPTDDGSCGPRALAYLFMISPKALLKGIKHFIPNREQQREFLREYLEQYADFFCTSNNRANKHILEDSLLISKLALGIYIFLQKQEIKYIVRVLAEDHLPPNPDILATDDCHFTELYKKHVKTRLDDSSEDLEEEKSKAPDISAILRKMNNQNNVDDSDFLTLFKRLTLEKKITYAKELENFLNKSIEDIHKNNKHITDISISKDNWLSFEDLNIVALYFCHKNVALAYPQTKKFNYSYGIFPELKLDLLIHSKNEKFRQPFEEYYFKYFFNPCMRPTISKEHSNFFIESYGVLPTKNLNSEYNDLLPYGDFKSGDKHYHALFMSSSGNFSFQKTGNHFNVLANADLQKKSFTDIQNGYFDKEFNHSLNPFYPDEHKIFSEPPFKENIEKMREDFIQLIDGNKISASKAVFQIINYYLDENSTNDSNVSAEIIPSTTIDKNIKKTTFIDCLKKIRTEYLLSLGLFKAIDNKKFNDSEIKILCEMSIEFEQLIKKERSKGIPPKWCNKIHIAVDILDRYLDTVSSMNMLHHNKPFISYLNKTRQEYIQSIGLFKNIDQCDMKQPYILQKIKHLSFLLESKRNEKCKYYDAFFASDEAILKLNIIDTYLEKLLSSNTSNDCKPFIKKISNIRLKAFYAIGMFSNCDDLFQNKEYRNKLIGMSKTYNSKTKFINDQDKKDKKIKIKLSIITKFLNSNKREDNPLIKYLKKEAIEAKLNLHCKLDRFRKRIEEEKLSWPDWFSKFGNERSAEWKTLIKNDIDPIIAAFLITDNALASYYQSIKTTQIKNEHYSKRRNIIQIREDLLQHCDNRDNRYFNYLSNIGFFQTTNLNNTAYLKDLENIAFQFKRRCDQNKTTSVVEKNQKNRIMIAVINEYLKKKPFDKTLLVHHLKHTVITNLNAINLVDKKMKMQAMEILLQTQLGFGFKPTVSFVRENLITDEPGYSITNLKNHSIKKFPSGMQLQENEFNILYHSLASKTFQTIKDIREFMHQSDSTIANFIECLIAIKEKYTFNVIEQQQLINHIKKAATLEGVFDSNKPPHKSLLGTAIERFLEIENLALADNKKTPFDPALKNDDSIKELIPMLHKAILAAKSYKKIKRSFFIYLFLFLLFIAVCVFSGYDFSMTAIRKNNFHNPYTSHSVGYFNIAFSSLLFFSSILLFIYWNQKKKIIQKNNHAIFKNRKRSSFKADIYNQDKTPLQMENISSQLLDYMQILMADKTLTSKNKKLCGELKTFLITNHFDEDAILEDLHNLSTENKDESNIYAYVKVN